MEKQDICPKSAAEESPREMYKEAYENEDGDNAETEKVGISIRDIEVSSPAKSSDNRGRILSGLFVKKSFGGDGDFFGIVTVFNAPYHKVLYEDGDEEELSESEVEVLICDKEIVPMSTLSKLSKGFNAALASYVAEKSAESKTKKSYQVQESNGSAIKYVCKDFPGFGNFYGAVSKYVKPFHKVIYADGDEEDFSDNELSECQCDVESVPADSVKKLAKLLKKAAKSNGSNDSKRQSKTAAVPIKSSETKGKRGRLATKHGSCQEPAKKRGRPRTNEMIDVPRTHQLLQSNKGHIDFADRQFLSRELVGVGNFYGVVIRFESPYYKTVFEDGVQDDVDEEEFAATCIPYTDVPQASLEFLQKHLELLNEESEPIDSNGTNDVIDSVAINFQDARAVDLNSKKLKERIVHEKLFVEKSSPKKREKKQKVNKAVKVKSRSPKIVREGEGVKQKKGRRKKGDDGPTDPLCNRFIKKNFDGFGNFFGIVKNFEDELYKIVYEDGDEEDMTLEDVTPLLVENDTVPEEKQTILDAWVYTYTYGPAIPPMGSVVPAKYIDLTPRELNQVDIYQRYIGRSFIDKDTGVEYVVKSVCRNETYSELLFRYFRKEEGDVGNDDFSGCGEMLNGVAGSWALWIVEPDKEKAITVSDCANRTAEASTEAATAIGNEVDTAGDMESLNPEVINSENEFEDAGDGMSVEDNESGYGSHGDEVAG